MTIEECIEILQSDERWDEESRAARMEAVRTLAEDGMPESIEALGDALVEAALHDDYAEVPLIAAALVAAGEFEPLVEFLSEVEDTGLIEELAEVIVSYGDVQSADAGTLAALLEVLEEEGPDDDLFRANTSHLFSVLPQAA